MGRRRPIRPFMAGAAPKSPGRTFLRAFKPVSRAVRGNKWRIIANIDYRHEIVYLVWIGSHAEYDKL
jgi:mRNA-degrading endonuclease HigB of HigAB toxin-antitoxin module